MQKTNYGHLLCPPRCALAKVILYAASIIKSMTGGQKNRSYFLSLILFQFPISISPLVVVLDASISKLSRFGFSLFCSALIAIDNWFRLLFYMMIEIVWNKNRFHANRANQTINGIAMQTTFRI